MITWVLSPTALELLENRGDGNHLSSAEPFSFGLVGGFFRCISGPSALLVSFEITVLPVNPSGGLVLDSRMCYRGFEWHWKGEESMCDRGKCQTAAALG
jgi:hypothetical protein